MTLNTNTTKKSYNANGSTPSFDFDFALQDVDDLDVYIDDTLQVTGYTVSIDSGGASGNVLFDTNPGSVSVPVIVLLARDIDYLQQTDLPAESIFPEATLEKMIDRAMMGIQQLDEKSDRALYFPITSGIAGSLTTPDPLDMIRVNATGDGVEPIDVATAFADAVPSAGLGNVIGPLTSVLDNVVAFANTNGQVLKDTGISKNNLITTSNLPPSIYNNIRAYLVSGSPYADGSSAGNGTVFAGPLPTGKKITVDNGSGSLSVLTLSEISLALTLTVNSSYSLFLVNTAGVLTLEVDVWSGINTPLTYGSDAAGRLCKSGATNKLLIAEFYCSTTNKIFDYTGDRSLANIYNQISKPFTAKIAASSWTYTTAVIRAINADTTNGSGRVRIFMGSVSGGIEAKYSQPVIMAGSASNPINCFGIGLDSITTFTGNIAVIAALGSSTVQFYATQTNLYSGTPSVGSHFLQMLEYCPAATAGATMIGTQTQGSNSLTGTLAA